MKNLQEVLKHLKDNNIQTDCYSESKTSISTCKGEYDLGIDIISNASQVGSRSTKETLLEINSSYCNMYLQNPYGASNDASQFSNIVRFYYNYSK